MKRWSNAYIFGLFLMGPLAAWLAVGQSTIKVVDGDWSQEYIVPQTSVYTVPPPSLLEVRCNGPTLEVIFRQNMPWNGSPIHKDVYVVENGEIVYSHRVEAVVTPQRTIPEKIEWPE